MSLELGLLGPISARVDGRALGLGPLKQQWVLAALVADANRALPLDQLTSRVWGERQPGSARATLRTYLSRVRAVFDGATADCAIRREGAGYVLAVDETAVDLHRFHRLLAQARADRNAGNAVEAAERYERALASWRGEEALAGMDTPWAAAFRARVHAERFAAQVERHEALLGHGEHLTLLPDLSALAAQHPLDERLAGLLLLALYRSGRQAEALAHYDTMRRRLADELGVDPGAELQDVYRQILTADPGLQPQPQPSAAPSPPRAPASAVPAQLPADSAAFTGRHAELDRLLALPAARHDAPTPTVVISSIDGMAGVGKTALAVHAAHRLAPAFPDGQLFLDLHGHTQGVDHVEPAAALESLLRALGVPGESIPPGRDERAALFRTRLAGARTLIVLDNVRDESQVVPLLPAAPGCLVVVTSRQRLVGLDDARQVSLDVLPPADAAALFRRVADPARLAGEPPERVAEVVELCGRLPLALRIAAARLASRPSWTLAHLAERLTSHHRLGQLQAGQRSVTAALDLSCDHLTPQQRRAYRLLGLHPGSDIDARAAAALAGTTVPGAVGLLDDLVDAHLLAEPAPGRYRFHDLVRAHATATAHAVDTDADRRGALGRLLDHYARAASLAMDAVYPWEADQRPRLPETAVTVTDFDADGDADGDGDGDADAAERWLDAELDNLLAAASHAAAHGHPDHLLHQSAVLHRHLRARGRYDDAALLHQQALRVAELGGAPADALSPLNDLGDIHYLLDRHEQATGCFERALRLARAAGDRNAEVKALTGLGHGHRLMGSLERSTDCFEQALRIAHATGNRHAEQYALHGLGHGHRLMGRHAQSADCFERALRLAHATGDRNAEVFALHGLGAAHQVTGRHERAVACFERALRIAEATGNRNGQQYALHGLGIGHEALGQYDQAAAGFGQMLRLARDCGDRIGEQFALYGLGSVSRLMGRFDEAAGRLTRMLRIARELAHRNGQFEAHDGLGRTHAAAGNPRAALESHHSALALAADLGYPADVARAHDGLAHAHQALGRHQRARLHWESALAILTANGLGHTTDPRVNAAGLRERLAECGTETPGMPDGTRIES